MDVKEQKFMHYWQKQLQKGKAYFVLTHGILWGMVAAFGSSLLLIGDNTLEEKFLSGTFLIKLIVMIAVGILAQMLQWHYNNKKYNKLLEECPNHY